jgi:hypothetical protein
MQLQDMDKAKVVHEHVWCTMCHKKGHHRNEFPTLGRYMVTGAPNPFPTRPQTKWCDIFRQWGHIPPWFPTLQKYQKTTHTLFWEFYKSMGKCEQLLVTSIDARAHCRCLRVQEENKGTDRRGIDRGGYQGGLRGGYG